MVSNSTRSIVVQRLISSWTRPDWAAVDVSGGAGRWIIALAPHFLLRISTSVTRWDTAQLDDPEFRACRIRPYRFCCKRAPTVCSVWSGMERRFLPRHSAVSRCIRGETALRNIRSYLEPGGIAILDVQGLAAGSKVRAMAGRNACSLPGRRYRRPAPLIMNASPQPINIGRNRRAIPVHRRKGSDRPGAMARHLDVPGNYAVPETASCTGKWPQQHVIDCRDTSPATSTGKNE